MWPWKKCLWEEKWRVTGGSVKRGGRGERERVRERERRARNGRRAQATQVIEWRVNRGRMATQRLECRRRKRTRGHTRHCSQENILNFAALLHYPVHLRYLERGGEKKTLTKHQPKIARDILEASCGFPVSQKKKEKSLCQWKCHLSITVTLSLSSLEKNPYPLHYFVIG